MITMLIYTNSESELNFIHKECKRFAALESDDSWDFSLCDSDSKLEKLIAEKEYFDLVCADVTTKAGLKTVQKIRSVNPQCHIILISSKEISAEEYVKPSVIPAGLMIRPLTPSHTREILGDNIKAYIRAFCSCGMESGFVIESKDGRRIIPYSVIEYFESREKKIMLYTGAMEYSFYGTLDKLEKTLPDDFMRCHRSFIVKKDKITNIMLSKSLMVLAGGEMIPISRTYKSVVKTMSFA